MPFANSALPTLRPGPQPPSPEVKPNGQVTWTKKEKQVDPKAPWESERNTCLRASEGLYLPYGLQEVVLAKFLDLKKKILTLKKNFFWPHPVACSTATRALEGGVLTTGPLACVCAKLLQLGLTLYHPMDCSPPASVPKFLDFLTLECKPCKGRNIIGLPTKVPGTQ